MDALSLVFKNTGGPAALSKLCGISPRAVFKWRVTGIPAGRVMQLYQACGGAVTPHQMRPDLYPDHDYRPSLSAPAEDSAA